MFFFQSPLAEMAVAMNDLAFIDRLWQDWSPGFDGTDHVRHAKDAMTDPAHLEAALGYYRATIGAGRRDPGLDQIEAAGAQPLTMAALYLHGADDGCMGADLIDDAVLDSLPADGSALRIVEGAGHFLHLERPDEVNALIVEFLGGGQTLKIDPRPSD
jgi:pimeloyl-ACP methyl ester carboxylesterase